MIDFQPAGFGQKSVQTSLGTLVYYTQTRAPWSLKAGRPTVVFLHSLGGGASAYEWSKVYPAIAATHQIIAPDLMGWGESSHPARRYRIEDYLLSLSEFLQMLPDPVTLVAASWTGALAVRLANQLPEKIRSLFLTCPSGFNDFGTGAGRRLPAPIINTPLLDQVIYALGATNEFAVRNFLEQFLFAKRDRISPEIVAAYLASAQQPNADYAALAFLRGDLYFDLAQDLPQLAVPTAVVWGARSQFTPLSLGRRLAALSSQVQQFHIVDDTGVLPQLEQPSVVAGLLVGWLKNNL
ncbi:alpha/beta hydrolase [Romeria aff. gracilis LEGE 07310]|uniref:Alpha/beta hydrolase n=1 Tax=Vasconcelosia minhoensis LEGE 07310 TaxID=915328 RepID=A0A8J7A6L7_9CYAN|nr:alpha/beta hydrolase [Romeria gracilis]MBE9077702.1 alpha/beta hydrolase [Romeria aff. gracilis LEGE 07310]